jgi:hypothetical protein
MSERRSKLADGLGARLTSFLSSPRLGLGQEQPELVEELLGGRPVPLERLDPRQPSENLPCLVHVSTLATEVERPGVDFVPRV